MELVLKTRAKARKHSSTMRLQVNKFEYVSSDRQTELCAFWFNVILQLLQDIRVHITLLAPSSYFLQETIDSESKGQLLKPAEQNL